MRTLPGSYPSLWPRGLEEENFGARSDGEKLAGSLSLWDAAEYIPVQEAHMRAYLTLIVMRR